MGHGYKGNTSHYHSISENIQTVAANYEYRNGYFGEPSPDGKSRNRNIASDNPVKTAKEFYDAIALGGREERLANGKGFNTRLADGTVVTWREVSSSDGTPAIDINVIRSNGSGGVKRQKIHFTLKED